MKIILIIFVLFFSTSVFSDDIVLYCSDIKVMGFEGDENYEIFKEYKETKFKVRLDLENKTITSNDLKLTEPVCGFLPKVSKDFDEFLYCIQYGYSFTLNLVDYRFTRSRGFGFVVSNKDDIGIAYGTCDKF